MDSPVAQSGAIARVKAGARGAGGPAMTSVEVAEGAAADGGRAAEAAVGLGVSAERDEGFPAIHTISLKGKGRELRRQPAALGFTADLLI
jgi:hypothetical protein